MQYPEFGTQVGRLKSLWLTILGMTGLGQGASHSLPHSCSTFISLAWAPRGDKHELRRDELPQRSHTGGGLHSRHSGGSSAARGASLACSVQRQAPLSYVAESAGRSRPSCMSSITLS